MSLFQALALFVLSINVVPFLPVDYTAKITAEVSVSIYVPMSGPENDWIDGNACYGKPWQTCFVQTGNAACGANYPRGTVFILPDDAVLYGLPAVVKCIDRGGAVGRHNLDLARVSPNVKADLSFARAWGRRTLKVGVILTRR